MDSPELPSSSHARNWKRKSGRVQDDVGRLESNREIDLR